MQAKSYSGPFWLKTVTNRIAEQYLRLTAACRAV
jgi:hypothetical protein